MPPDWDKVHGYPEIKELQAKIVRLETTVTALQAQIKDKSQTNKHGLPVDLKIQAEVESVGTVWLQVTKTNYQVIQIGGQQIVEGKRFKSLSAAAEFFSGITRKSGWVYWRTEEGRTLKDVYKG